jgi:hypothetical protein
MRHKRIINFVRTSKFSFGLKLYWTWNNLTARHFLYECQFLTAQLGPLCVEWDCN